MTPNSLVLGYQGGAAGLGVSHDQAIERVPRPLLPEGVLDHRPERKPANTKAEILLERGRDFLRGGVEPVNFVQQFEFEHYGGRDQKFVLIVFHRLLRPAAQLSKVARKSRTTT